MANICGSWNLLRRLSELHICGKLAPSVWDRVRSCSASCVFVLRDTRVCLPIVLKYLSTNFFARSPRWLIKKGRYGDAYIALKDLRQTPLQAARKLNSFFINWLMITNELIQETCTPSTHNSNSKKYFLLKNQIYLGMVSRGYSKKR